jgi:Ca2+-binding EF-hand superfamily protein
MKKTIALAILSGLGIGGTVFAEAAQTGGPQHAFFFEKLDQNADGKVTRDELKTSVLTRFTAVDTNGDGKITSDEAAQHSDAKAAELKGHFAERLKQADKNADGKWTKDELSRMPERWFNKLDTNSDGVVTQAELDAKRAERAEKFGEHREKFREHLFSRIDANGDGAVDSTEAQTFAGTRFDKLDANQDGSVDLSEWKAGHPHGFGHHRGHHGHHGRDGGSEGSCPKSTTPT